MKTIKVWTPEDVYPFGGFDSSRPNPDNLGDNVDLKECPFCGSDNVDLHFNYDEGHYVRCDTCGAQTAYVKSSFWDLAEGSEPYGKRLRANANGVIRLWNTRQEYQLDLPPRRQEVSG